VHTGGEIHVLVLCFQGAAKEPHSNAKDSSGAGCKYSTVLLPNEFLKMCKLSQINIPKLLWELKEDNLVFKISGFADTLAKRQAQQATSSMIENVTAKQNGRDKKVESGALATGKV
jgi:hypothetical protein